MAPISAALPERVLNLIRSQETASERLIGWVQLALVATFAGLYVVAPRPTDSLMAMFAPVPIALATYAIFTMIRLALSYRMHLPAWFLALSIFADTLLLLVLIWSFHLQYDQPPAFSLKVPTFIYIFVFIALRALRFDHRYLLMAGLSAALGWTVLVAAAVLGSADGAITRNFVTYIAGNGILIGAEFDKVLTILLVTVVLTIAVRRAKKTLMTAVREETAGREVARFLSSGVAEVIAKSRQQVRAGDAAERDAAILMLDIRGFTSFSKTVAPTEVVRMLTGFHSIAVPLIRAHGGVIDKFLGDGIMATFGAVEASRTAAADALRALDAVMLAAAHWRESLPAMGVSVPLEVNAAVAAGRVVFAAVGSDQRLEYTVIGEAVNLAAKLEKHNKTERCRALASAATFDLAVAQGYVPARPPEPRLGARVGGVADPLDVVILAA